MESAGINWRPRSIVAADMEAGTQVRCADHSHHIDMEIILYDSMHRYRPEVARLLNAVISGVAIPG